MERRGREEWVKEGKDEGKVVIKFFHGTFMIWKGNKIQKRKGIGEWVKEGKIKENWQLISFKAHS